MSDIASALTQMARIKTPESRAALALGVTDICTAKPLSNRVEPIANDLLLSLAHKVEEQVRVQMANKLAGCNWAPRGIIRFLAFDAPSVAESIIAQSQVLEAEDLVELAETGSEKHRIMIAERLHIGIAVSDAAAFKSEIRVLRSLAQNHTARLSERTLDKCFNAADEDDEIAHDLLERDDAPPSLIDTLTRKISGAVRDQVEKHFDLKPGALAETVIETTTLQPAEDEEEEIRKLVEQMSAMGELDGTLVVRALTDGKILFFDYALADLCGLPVENWRAALGASSMRATALACRAARIDKSLFPSVVRGMQKAGRIQDDLPSDAMMSAANIFQKFTPGSAYDALRRLALSV
ncbi:DUF2336 domain-containing protein [Hyphobacterium sp.]|uniref:DUF2336 domain-containing protein n=1 Tax=Hyphobacterium sp. TaxID=2004662 RepID=UPI003BAA9604